MSSAYLLLRLLETEPELHISGSAHITVDQVVAEYIGHQLSLPGRYVYATLGGRPVKVALGIRRWLQRMPKEERVKALANYSERHGRYVRRQTVLAAMALVEEAA